MRSYNGKEHQQGGCGALSFSKRKEYTYDKKQIEINACHKFNITKPKSRVNNDISKQNQEEHPRGCFYFFGNETEQLKNYNA